MEFSGNFLALSLKWCWRKKKHIYFCFVQRKLNLCFGKFALQVPLVAEKKIIKIGTIFTSTTTSKELVLKHTPPPYLYTFLMASFLFRMWGIGTDESEQLQTLAKGCHLMKSEKILSLLRFLAEIDKHFSVCHRKVTNKASSYLKEKISARMTLGALQDYGLNTVDLMRVLGIFNDSLNYSCRNEILSWRLCCESQNGVKDVCLALLG